MMELEVQATPSTSVDQNPNLNQKRLGMCEVCAAKDAKYTCPRCEVKTCSLQCNKIHKLEVECDGQRDKAKFIPMNRFTNLDLSTDYRLLEEINRVVEVSKKSRPERNFRLDKRSFKLQKEAVKRKTTVKVLPSSFQRHKTNTSYFNFKQQLIYWHVDFKFGELKLSQTVPENLKLATVFEKCLSKQTEETAEQLQYFQAAGLTNISFLLKAEQQKGRRFYELDMNSTLTENFKDKLLIEHPTIHLVLKDQQSFYDIIDSDDDEDIKEGLKEGHRVIKNIIKKSESDTCFCESLKNFLFISEYSDEDHED